MYQLALEHNPVANSFVTSTATKDLVCSIVSIVYCLFSFDFRNQRKIGNEMNEKSMKKNKKKNAQKNGNECNLKNERYC